MLPARPSMDKKGRFWVTQLKDLYEHYSPAPRDSITVRRGARGDPPKRQLAVTVKRTGRSSGVEVPYFGPRAMTYWGHSCAAWTNESYVWSVRVAAMPSELTKAARSAWMAWASA